MKVRPFFRGLFRVLRIPIVGIPLLIFGSCEIAWQSAKLKASLENFDAEVTVETIYRGKPITFSATYKCIRKIRTDEGCFLCKSWKSNIGSYAFELPDSDWVVFDKLSGYCDSLPKQGRFFDSRALIGLTDDIHDPSYLKVLSPESGYSQVVAGGTPFDLFRTSFKYRPSNSSSGRRPAVFQPDLILSPLRIQKWGNVNTVDFWADRSVTVIPASLWKNEPVIEAKKDQEAGVQKISFTAEEWSIVREMTFDSIANGQRAVSNAAKSGMRLADKFAHIVPLVPNGTGLWRLDYSQPSVHLNFPIGQRCVVNSSRSDCIELEKFFESQKLFVQGKAVNFPTRNDRYVYYVADVDSFLVVRPFRLTDVFIGKQIQGSSPGEN